jgi:hypothetical protein
VLVTPALETARDRGAGTMEISVGETDMAARRLYESLGFTTDRRPESRRRSRGDRSRGHTFSICLRIRRTLTSSRCLSANSRPACARSPPTPCRSSASNWSLVPSPALANVPTISDIHGMFPYDRNLRTITLSGSNSRSDGSRPSVARARPGTVVAPWGLVLRSRRGAYSLARIPKLMAATMGPVTG